MMFSLKRYQLKQVPQLRYFRSTIAVFVLGLALSGCNTTGEGGASQTALLSSVSENTDPDKTAEAASATETVQAVADASVDAVTPVNGEATAAVVTPETAVTDVQLAGLPQEIPVPTAREAAIPMIAYANARAETSPGSLATNLAFETPAHAPTGLDELIQKYASTYEVPERLVRRVVHRESKFNPAARNGPYWGLMQISHPTARGMGYRGQASGLLDAETNLKYAVKYLAGAYKVADGDESQAVRFYARGYYYDAKRKGLLEETGLRPARK